MDFKPIFDFLGRYKNLRNEQGEALKILKETLFKLGCDVSPTSVKLKNNILFVDGHPALKQFILINKEKILENLSIGLNKKITDIH